MPPCFRRLGFGTLPLLAMLAACGGGSSEPAAQAAPNKPPVVTLVSDVRSPIGLPTSQSVRASDPDGDPLVYAASGLPAGLDIDSATGAIAGTPIASGIHAIVVSVSDRRGGVVRVSFQWIVEPPPASPNQSPALEWLANRNSPTGQPVALQLRATDVDDLTLDYTVTGLPQGLVADAATGFVSGTPTTPGTSSVTVRVSDRRGGAVEQTFSWTIRDDQNVLVIENSKSAADGVSDAWEIRDEHLAQNQEIEGYASLNSVRRGDSIQLFVNVKDPVADPTYDIDIYRMGWYGGAGGRKVFPTVTRASRTQPACPVVDASTNTIECSWQDAYTLMVPDDPDPTIAMSGVYLAKLTTARGRSRYVIFVVRDDSRTAAFLFQTSVTTYAAYNTWGGHSFYTTTPTYAASFDRPYDNVSWGLGSQRSLKGAGDFLEWEIRAVRFLERSGYDVLYSTNIDTHSDPQRLTQFKGFLSVGHDEYWSSAMYDAIEGARNAGVSLAFLGANNAYWAVRLEQSSRGDPHRRVVTYRYNTVLDPQHWTPNATVRWREEPLSRPEAGLIGVQYDYNTVDLDMVISNCTSWICDGSGLKAGDTLPGLLGYEIDKVQPGVSPNDILVISASPYVVGTETRYANMTYYTHASGAGVFATGSMQWNWGLDAYAPHPERAHAGAQQITKNVLDRFLAPR